MRKKPYPYNDDIAEAIKEAISKDPLMHPDELPDKVKEVLEEKGFYTGLVSAKRVWRIYESMVRRGEIFDVFMVVRDEGDLQV